MCTRLIVKNLPLRITEDKLRETFSKRGGKITDIQLKYTKPKDGETKGKFRGFGFVGFQNEEDAKEAKRYFDGAFIGATKVKVEECKDIGDKEKPRAWSKYSKENQKEKVEEEEEEEKGDKKKKKEKKKQKKVDALLEKYKDDPKFQEFLRIHKRNAGVWNNDAILEVGKSYLEEDKEEEEEEESVKETVEEQEEDEEKEEEEEASDSESEDDVKNAAVSDLDYLKAKVVTEGEEKEKEEKPKKEKKKKEPKNEEYFTVKISNLPTKAKKSHVKKFLKPSKAKSIRIPQKVKGFAFVGFATEEERRKVLAKNKSILLGNQVLVKPYDKKKEEEDPEKRWREQEEGLKDEESVAESGRIFVRNLSYTVTEEEIEELFKRFGPLTEVNLPIDKMTRKVKGFAFVTFMMPENAVQAMSELDNTSFQGRMLHLIPGKAKQTPEELASAEGLTFKQRKALKEKAQSGSSHNWNSLFLGSSAVADLMAEKYSVSKSDVLTGGGKQSAAVRLALGETQIVAETRQFLEEQGVTLDAFSRPPAARSKTVILIKNLPAKTPVEEIRDLFAKHGELGRVVLPPNGITALVEFFEATEARKAFRGLAYSKFHGTPLYLEWAPDNTFKTEARREDDEAAPSKIAPVNVSDDAEPEPNSTLFVKNLNFDTTDNDLRDFFAPCGTVHTAAVSKKKDASRPGEMLSMGYGFVTFKTKSAADKALKTLQHKRLDDHCLELKRSTRVGMAKDEEVKTTRKGAKATEQRQSTKMVVRNVPFEANAREVEEIFKTFGDLKSVRLPKKVTGSHRGFAFVEFQSKEEAAKAFDALCHSTHLYGRRLVLEWAEEEETIEDLRRKTASSYVEGAPPGKRAKKQQIVESVILGGGGKKE